MEFSTKTVIATRNLLVSEIKQQLMEGAKIDACEVEQSLRQVFQEIGCETLSQVWEMQDEIAHERGVNCPRAEGRRKEKHKVRRISRRSAQVSSVFGEVNYVRGYYHCATCQQRWHALDEESGLKPGQATPKLGELLAFAGVLVPFEKAQEVIARYLMLHISANTIRSETQAMGAKQQVQEERWLEQSQDLEYLQRRRREIQEKPQQVYGSIDGVFVPLKEEWMEAKIVSWYRAGKPYGREEAQAIDLHSYISLDKAATFGKLMWAAGVEHDADLAEEIVFVCDGAAWIWNLVEMYYPNAVQIVDWYHACEYLAAVGKALYPHDDDLAMNWFEQHKEFLWEGETDLLIKCCQRIKDHPSAGEKARKAITYFTNNQKRMDYALFRQQGYFIGSGTVESSCKQVVTMRLKAPGARWTQHGALATAKARTAWLNGNWDHLAALPLAA
jgi:hypothetical protein